MKPFTTAAVGIFAIISIVHVLRLFFGWTANINGTDVPIWISGIGALVSCVLALMVWREKKG
jgi:hypothetical protein